MARIDCYMVFYSSILNLSRNIIVPLTCREQDRIRSCIFGLPQKSSSSHPIILHRQGISVLDRRPQAGLCSYAMNLQSKKSFAAVDYERCDPKGCSPEIGRCASASGCAHKVIKQIDGLFEQPLVFQDMCMGCWDCIEACPLNAVRAMHLA